jgi:hypothetical protein
VAAGRFAVSVPLCAIIAFCPVGCSNRQVYDAIQENRRAECGKLPQRRYEDCMRAYEVPYDEYERRRQEAP